MKKLSILLICLVYGFNPLDLISQTSYYVSTNGANSNNGLSINNAWRTVQYAMENATPNSVVNILAGTYAKGWVSVSGTPNNMITFKNYNGQEVIIDGGSTGVQTTLIGMDGASYIRIEGLILKNATGNFSSAIYIANGSHHIEFVNNEISNIHFSNDPNAVVTENTNANPVIVYNENGTQSCNNILFQGNKLFDCRTGFSEGLALNGNVENFEISNNEVFNITNIGIDIIGHEETAPMNDQARNGVVRNNKVYNCKSPYAIAAGIYVDGGKDLIIEKNEVYNGQWGIEVGCENIGKTTSNVIVRNNLIYNNEDAGVVIGGFDYPLESGKVTNSKILNNTCYNNDTNSGGLGGVTGEVNITYTENCTLENNIFYTATSSDIILFVDDVNSLGLVLDYNDFYIQGNVEFEYEGTTYTNINNYKNATGQDAHSLFDNPDFINAATTNFQLQNTSPAIDNGNPSFMAATGETDFNGAVRVQNTRVDMGAFEFQSSNCPNSLTLNGNIPVGTYTTSGLLTSSGTVSTSGLTRFEGENIQLSSGFYAPLGSDFIAVIAPCAAATNTNMNYLKLSNTKHAAAISVITENNNLSSYPNPVVFRGTVQYQINKKSRINLSLYSVLGQQIRVLDNHPMKEAGIYQYDLDTSNLEEGLYYLRLVTNEDDLIEKIVVANNP